MWLNEIKIIESTFTKPSSKGKPFIYKRKKQIAVLKCDNCESIFDREIHEISPKRRNNDYKHFCNGCDAKSLGGKIAGQIRNEKYECEIGKIIKPKGGYLEVYVRKSHQFRPDQDWVRQHIIVVENHIGRRLTQNEVVHHIDGDKMNNNIENLDICTVTEHNNCHAKAEQIVFQLYKEGKVLYDKNKKQYYLV
jgi:transcription elongation factor Elf1